MKINNVNNLFTLFKMAYNNQRTIPLPNIQQGQAITVPTGQSPISQRSSASAVQHPSTSIITQSKSVLPERPSNIIINPIVAPDARKINNQIKPMSSPIMRPNPSNPTPFHYRIMDSNQTRPMSFSLSEPTQPTTPNLAQSPIMQSTHPMIANPIPFPAAHSNQSKSIPPIVVQANQPTIHKPIIRPTISPLVVQPVISKPMITKPTIPSPVQPIISKSMMSPIIRPTIHKSIPSPGVQPNQPIISKLISSPIVHPTLANPTIPLTVKPNQPIISKPMVSPIVRPMILTTHPTVQPSRTVKHISTAELTPQSIVKNISPLVIQSTIAVPKQQLMLPSPSTIPKTSISISGSGHPVSTAVTTSVNNQELISHRQTHMIGKTFISEETPKLFTQEPIIRPKATDIIHRYRTTKAEYKNYSVYIGQSSSYRSNDLMNITPSNFLHVRFFNDESTIIYKIMCELSSEEIYKLVNLLIGFDMKHILSLDLCYNLLWYLNMVDIYELYMKEVDMFFPLNKCFNSFDTNTILKLLGPSYHGPKDPVSIIIAFVTGLSINQPLNIYTDMKYQIIKQFPPCIAYSIQMAISFPYALNIKRNTYLTQGVEFPPYIDLSLTKLNPSIEPIILALTYDNIDELIDKYQIVISPWRIYGPQDKVYNFVRYILPYDKVLNRPSNLSPPPENADRSILEQYTYKELIDAYDPGQPWVDRATLIDTIIDESYPHPRWYFKNRFCNNDNTMNLSDLIPHGKMNKDDTNNVTLAYGLRWKYRCYQMNELMDSFREYDGVFRFKVPDWINVGDNPNQRLGPIDPTTDQPLPEEFSRTSMQQLAKLLGRGLQRYNTYKLQNIIETGLKVQLKPLATLKQEYDTFTNEQKDLADLFLIWLFICAMWMRFWLGPGFPWADVRLNMGNEQRCIPTKREKHIQIQQGIYGMLQNKIHSDNIVWKWIDNLPEVSYDFQMKRINAERSDTIISVLNGLFYQNQCMGYGGDQIVQSAYGIATSLHSSDQFDQLIAKYLPEILDMEALVVEGLLKDYTGTPEDAYTKELVQTLRERQSALQKPIPFLPPFNPEKVQYNPHTV